MATITKLEATMSMKDLVDALNKNFENSQNNTLQAIQLVHQSVSDNAVTVNNNFAEVKKEFAKLEKKLTKKMDVGFKKIDDKLDTILYILNKK